LPRTEFDCNGIRSLTDAGDGISSLVCIQKPRIEWLRQQFADPMAACLTLEIRKNYLQIAREFPQDLTARAARWSWRLRWGDHYDPAELAVTFGERLEYRDALGAHGEPVRGVLDVAAGDNRAVCRFKGGAYLEVREVGARMFANRTRSGNQLIEPRCFFLRIPDPGSRIPA
jgi:hypothetical protein